MNSYSLRIGLRAVEDGTVAVHENHGGGEVEEAGGEDEGVVGQRVRLAEHEAVRVEVEAGGAEHDEGVEGHGGQAREQDAQEHHLGKEVKKRVE